VAGAPVWVILATGFCVNLRFVVFSLHLRPYLMHLPLWQRLTHGYLTADLSYVLFVRRFPRARHRRGRPSGAGGLPGRQLLRQLVQLDRRQRGGRGAGQFHPHALGAGLCRHPVPGGHPVLAGHHPDAWCVLCAVAGAAAVVAYALPLKLNIVVAIAVAVILCLTLEKPQPPASVPGATA
jgi:hypothetical protein